MNGFVAKPISPARLWHALLSCIPARAGLGQTSTLAQVPAVLDSADAQPLLAALRGIAGMDVNRGLFSTNHKSGFYISMLRKFVISQASAIENIRHALEVNDGHRAERIAHTLKGLAGTLGATSLQVSALALEGVLRQRDAMQATLSAIAHTESVLAPLIHALRAVPGLIASEPRKITVLSASERKAGCLVLERIRELLHQSNAGVLDLWQEHASTLQALLENAAEIEDAINGFEFDIALQLIEHSRPATV
jgi:polar amino acid transport system substrate-binding protein